MNKKVMVAMSGGIDSSMAAVLLKKQGYELVGATMKLFSGDVDTEKEYGRSCCSLADIEDARRTSYSLGFDYYVLNFGDDFKKEVIDRFAKAYQSGITPNPCIDCNRYMKFRKLYERARLIDVDYIATGHYARVDQDPQSGRFLLKKAKDQKKDQTYVLYAMKQRQLEKTLFPLGGYTKDEIRQMADRLGLVNARKPDSQDICFVEQNNYGSYLNQTLGLSSNPGQIVNSQGDVLGTHRGLIHYTIGQRKGLNLHVNKPQYVIKKDAASNIIIVGDEDELFCDTMIVNDVNLISVETLTAPMSVAVKIRYSHQEAPATISPTCDGNVMVRFQSPQRAITPGQAAVFYDDEVVVGGGTIV